MKDTTSMMANDMPPPPFKLERELTLMPNEFRERLSASTRSRKSSAARSAVRRSRHERHSAAPRVSKPPTVYGSSRHTYINDYNNIVQRSKDNMYNNNNSHDNVYNQSLQYEDTELQNSGKYYDANHKVMSFGEQETLFNTMERAYSIKTPPTNMNIHDLTEPPLDDWNSNEVIKEKKYAVLPSIGKQTPSPTKSDVILHNPVDSLSSHYSYSNQLDYGRSRMEQEADFFADFRVNTSVVQATPRQNPLPPIDSKKNPQNGEFSTEEKAHLKHSAGKVAQNHHDFLGLESMNARQMSGRHRKKSFKY